MKRLILFLLLFSTTLAFSNEQAQKAEELFNNRGLDAIGAKKALDASLIYESLAGSESNLNQKAEYFILSAEATYFYADNVTDLQTKINYFLKGSELALKGSALLEKTPGNPSLAKDVAQSPRLARGYYWHGVNKARWAEANGILNSLSEWPNIKKYMLFIIEELKQPQTQFYGPNRILGKAYMKLPFPLGSNSSSLKYLREAFEKTIENDPDDISIYGINCLYYAEILAATGDSDFARAILETLIAKGASEASIKSYNPKRVPETKKEIEEAKRVLQNL